MRFRVTLKTPDALDMAIATAVANEPPPEGLDEDDIDEGRENLRTMVADLCRKWFRYGEVLTVEIDTDAETCEVCED